MTEDFDHWAWVNEQHNAKRPSTKEIYDRYFEEGRADFLKSLDPNLYPHRYSGSDEWYEGFPWRQGFTAECDRYFTEKYRIAELQREVKRLVESRGCTVEYTDEYQTPYLKSPEGWIYELA